MPIPGTTPQRPVVDVGPLAHTIGQPVFTVERGALCWRGIPMGAEHAARALVLFREAAPWDRGAQSLATELEAAMRAAGYLKEEAA